MKSSFLRSIFLAVLILVASSTAFTADNFPSRPIRLIVPFAPGGGTDMVGRVIAPRLSERFSGTPVVVDNRGGAGAIIGTGLVAKAAPDGYTLLVCDTAHAIQPTLQKLEYDPIKSFSPIASLVTGPMVLVSPANLPVKTVQDFVALAKQKPGQLVAGTAGPGSSGHMAVELFRVMAGIDLIMAHYKGAGAALIDVLGGAIQVSSQTLQAAIPHLKGGRLRALGATDVKRSSLLPDVPTVAESGVPGYQAIEWRGLMGPAGMPATIVNRLTGEVKAIMSAEDTKAYFLNNGMEVAYRDPRQFTSFITDEIKRWSEVVKAAHISLDAQK
jgi:tripartite-type tricarboxylate transporter receptor subunit TctC